MAPDVRKKFENDIFQANAGGPSDSYGISLEELKSLMKERGHEGLSHVEAYGGVEGLCKKLKTDPTTGMLHLVQ